MGRYATETGGGDFQHAPVGTHVARCIRLIDLGTQQGEWMGKPIFKNQVLVMWELCNEMMEGEEKKPFIVSKFYTNSLSEKANLRKDLEQWRSRPFTHPELLKFDLQSILGAACLLSVVEKGGGKEGVKVSGVMKLPKGQEAPAAKNEAFVFWLDEFDATRFESLSDGLKKIIQKSPEYGEATGEKPVARKPGRFDDMPDDGYGDDISRAKAREEEDVPF